MLPIDGQFNLFFLCYRYIAALSIFHPVLEGAWL